MRLPGDTDRTIVIGRTGSGKSVHAIWQLSKANFDEIPWVIIDYKGEDLIAKMRKRFGKLIKTISPHDKPPTKPGLYWMKPAPKVDDEAIEAWLWKVWKQTNVGLFVDEGYALPQKAAFDVILTQGRSLHIPVIALYQRPVYMSRYAVAQANFFAVYDQNDKRDLVTTAQFLKPAVVNGKEIPIAHKLPKYWFTWMDVSEGESVVCKPVPNERAILQTFSQRLGDRSKGRML
jgi:hypothetical protein